MNSGIAIYGGTFDPIHYGHLRSALELKDRLGLSEVRLVPAQLPPHRDTPGATSEQRLAMLGTAIREFPGLVIDQREMRRSGPSFTIDTLMEIREEVGHGEALVFILGSDAFSLIHEWYRWRELTDYANLIVMERPAANARVLDSEVNEWLLTRLVSTPEKLMQASGQIAKVKLTPIDISATQIRKRCANGLCLENLVPVQVAQYIEHQCLYGTKRGIEN